MCPVFAATGSVSCSAARLGGFRQGIGCHQRDPGDGVRVPARGLDRDVAAQPVTKQRKATGQGRPGFGDCLLDGVCQSGGQHNDRTCRPQLDDLRHEAPRVGQEAGNDDQLFSLATAAHNVRKLMIARDQHASKTSR